MEQIIEIWRPVPGYYGYYEVSNLGRVKSLERVVNHPIKSSKTIHEKIMSPGVSSNGYLIIGLSKDGITKHYTIHRLVARVFLPNPNNFKEINHKGNKHDNMVIFNQDGTINYDLTTIEWCDRRYNCNFGLHNIKLSQSLTNHTGLSHRVICLETKEVYPSLNEVQRQTGIAESSVCACLKGKRHTAGGYHWEYAW